MLKKEIRILGLSISRELKGRRIVVGVVFRGKSWLDGVFTCSLDTGRGDSISRISKAVTKSRQYSQLHAVIISTKRNVLQAGIDLAELARKIKLPVISITQKHRASKRKGNDGTGVKHYELIVNHKQVSVLAKGITAEKAQEVFAIASGPHSQIPEAARVANLITDQGFCLVGVGHKKKF